LKVSGGNTALLTGWTAIEVGGACWINPQSGESNESA